MVIYSFHNLFLSPVFGARFTRIEHCPLIGFTCLRVQRGFMNIMIFCDIAKKGYRNIP